MGCLSDEEKDPSMIAKKKKNSNQKGQREIR